MIDNNTIQEEAENKTASSKQQKKNVNVRSARFSDAPWYSPGIKLLLGGAGGIGSWLSLMLSRQEAELYIFDFDEIDETNMAGQHFTTDDIGKNKASVAAEQAKLFSANTKIHAFGRYEEDSFSHNLVFSAFDNMAARKLMFEKWVEYISSKEMENKPAIYIDGRLLAEEMQIYAVTRDKISEYRKYLWDDSEVPDVPCSFKATSHCSAIIAGLMTSIYNNFLTNLKYGFIVREVPFRTTFETPTLLFNTRENEKENKL